MQFERPVDTNDGKYEVVVRLNGIARFSVDAIVVAAVTYQTGDEAEIYRRSNPAQ